jgi:hypothetical protein
LFSIPRSSFGQYGNEKRKQLFSRWPVAEPKDYVPWLNHPQPKEEVENILYAIKRSRPYGSEPWVSKPVAQFGLENTLRNPCAPYLTPFSLRMGGIARAKAHSKA